MRRFAGWIMQDAGFDRNANYDGQLAIDTAGLLLVSVADPDVQMICLFVPHGDSLRVALSAPSMRDKVPSTDGWDWGVVRMVSRSAHAYHLGPPFCEHGIMTFELVLSAAAAGDGADTVIG